MRTITVVVAILLAAGTVPAAKLPSYVKTCKFNDPKLNECALKNGREAIPQLINGDSKLGIPKLDPLEIEKIVVGDGKTGGGVGISLTCHKCKIGGLKAIVLDEFKIDTKKRHIELRASVSKLTLKGRYTAEGKVLVLPIQGDGDADLTLGDLKMVYKVEYDLQKGKGGKEYAHLKNAVLDFKPEKFNIHLTNLFNGDKTLGTQMNTFLNENWRDVLKEFGPAIGETINKVIFTIIHSVTDKIPFEEIFPK